MHQGQAPEYFTDRAPLRDPSVVHASYGRLRVHLPHWSGTGSEILAAGVRHLPGVTGAQANPLTGNVLILFEPEQTTVPVLLATLPAAPLDLPASLPLGGDRGGPRAPDDLHVQRTTLAGYPAQQDAGARNGDYVTGPRAVLYKALGWSSIGLAVVGAITPGIPTAPFVILAGYFFIRSSPEAHAWLRRSRWFGPLLRDWEAHRGVRRSVRNAALALVGGSMVLVASIGLPAPLTISILACQAVGLAIVLRLRVVESASLVPEGDALHGVPA
jgi:uncharacterized membrane protein YbaN (DUF454 family)